MAIFSDIRIFECRQIVSYIDHISCVWNQSQTEMIRHKGHLFMELFFMIEKRYHYCHKARSHLNTRLC